MDNKGKNIRKVVDHPENDYMPDWSPDGTKLAFTSNRNGNQDIFTVDIDGKRVTQLTEASHNERKSRWSPDGTHIAFQLPVKTGKSLNNEIGIIDIEGKTVCRVTNNPGWDTHPHWFSKSSSENGK